MVGFIVHNLFATIKQRAIGLLEYLMSFGEHLSNPEHSFEQRFETALNLHYQQANVDSLKALMASYLEQEGHSLSTASELLAWSKLAKVALLTAALPGINRNTGSRLLTLVDSVIWQQIAREPLADVVRSLRQTHPLDYTQKDREILMLHSGVMGDFCQRLYEFSLKRRLLGLASNWYKTGLRMTLPERFVRDFDSDLDPIRLERYQPLSLDQKTALWSYSLLQQRAFPQDVHRGLRHDPYCVDVLTIGYQYLSLLKHHGESRLNTFTYQVAVREYADYLNHSMNLPYGEDESFVEISKEVLEAQQRLQRPRLPLVLWNWLNPMRPKPLTPLNPSFFTYRD